MVIPQKIQKGWYRHFKGGLYQVVDTVIESESLSTMVLYRPKDSGYLWVRPYQMFISEVTREGETHKRFTYIGESLPE
ncbi:DUF1653 domain-containing protein, partial [Sphaerochaeta sp.]|jgi:hypothetical protein